MEAVVLAGGILRQNGKNIIKGLIKIQEKGLLESTLIELKKCSYIKKIILVAPKEALNPTIKSLIDEYILDTGTGTGNIQKGLEAVRDSKKAFLCASDIPFINSSAIGKFIEKCPSNADICYAIFEKNGFDEILKTRKNIYVKLKDGLFTGGSILMVNPDVILSNKEIVNDFFNARKSLLKLSSLLGAFFLLKFIFGILNIKEVEEKIGRILKCRCIAILGASPLLSIDIDNTSDLIFAIRYAKTLKENKFSYNKQQEPV